MNSEILDSRFVASPLEVTEFRLRERGYSQQTVKAYIGQLKSFFSHISPRAPEEVLEEDLREYLDHLNDNNKSRSTIDQAVNALRFIWKEGYGKTFPMEKVPRPEKKERLPVFLSLDEVRQIAMASENLKHRLMIELAYSAGLRVSEVVNIRVCDLNLQTKNLYVRSVGKNPKGRTTIFSRNLEDELVRQIGTKEPDDFLFPSERGGQLTTRAFAKYFKAALDASGINKQATPHSLRHSFAALLLQAGTKVRTVQNLLGHVRRESTTFYAKLGDSLSQSGIAHPS